MDDDEMTGIKQGYTTTIQVQKRTRDRLDKTSLRNETYDELINRLIDEHEAHSQETRDRVRETWEDLHE